MNPNKNIAPSGSNNEILRRIANIFYDGNGNPRPGNPGGPLIAKTVGDVYRHAATGPSPTPAYLLAPADDTRVGGYISNLDQTLTIWWGSDPNLTDQTGATLGAGQTAPANIRGPVYIYCISGAPLVEFVPVFP
jgi:hypothetical protein